MPALVMAILLPVHASLSVELSENVWNHGSQDCDSSPEPAIDIYQFDAATFILQRLIAQRSGPRSTGHLRVLVAHSHSHSDHTAGDASFATSQG